jgi:hypothetical protein
MAMLCGEKIEHLLVSRADADFQISDRQSVEKNTYNVDSI